MNIIMFDEFLDLFRDKFYALSSNPDATWQIEEIDDIVEQLMLEWWFPDSK